MAEPLEHTAPAARRCPVCDRATEARVCPQDQVATLLEDAPEASAGSVQRGAVVAERYALQRRIGGGAYAAVFEAKHLGTGQNVALKILSKGPGRDGATAARRFFLEARVSSGLKHPNTVRVFDFGQDDSGLLYIAMELLVGRTLREEVIVRRRENRPFAEAEAAAVGSAVLRSLSEAHKAGLVHRDLKPENIFLHQLEDEDPIVKVLDFGVVKETGNPVRLTQAASVVGTPAYMSPEQVQDKALDARSDLYALALILFELVTLQRPFGGTTALEVAHARLREAPRDLKSSALGPVSEDFVLVVQRAMAREPSARFKDAVEMRAALDRGRPGVQVSSGLSIMPGNDPTRVEILPAARAPMTVSSADVVPIETPLPAPPLASGSGGRLAALLNEDRTVAAPPRAASLAMDDRTVVPAHAGAPKTETLAEAAIERPARAGQDEMTVADRGVYGAPPRAAVEPRPSSKTGAPSAMLSRASPHTEPSATAVRASSPLPALRRRSTPWAALALLMLGGAAALYFFAVRARDRAAPAEQEPAAEQPVIIPVRPTLAATPTAAAPRAETATAAPQAAPAPSVEAKSPRRELPAPSIAPPRPSRRAEPKKAPSKKVQEMLDLRI